MSSKRKRKCCASRADWAASLPLTVRTTFLGAHAVPPEYAARADDYIDEICERMLPALAEQGLVDAVDAFCESIGFSEAQTERVFQTAQRLGLPVKLHAEQLSDQGGAQLVARYARTIGRSSRTRIGRWHRRDGAPRDRCRVASRCVLFSARER